MVRIKLSAHILGRSELEIKSKFHSVIHREELDFIPLETQISNEKNEKNDDLDKENEIKSPIIERNKKIKENENKENKQIKQKQKQIKKTKKKAKKPKKTTKKTTKKISKENKKYIWPDAWFGLLDCIHIEKSNAMKLHEIYYSHQWIRERYLIIEKSINENLFNDTKLIDNLKIILPESKLCFLPYLIACISGKSIDCIRCFLISSFQDQFVSENLNLSENKKLIKEKYQNLIDQVSSLVFQFNFEKKPKNSDGISNIIDILEKIQKKDDHGLLIKLCEHSKILFENEVKNSGGFFVVNTIDDGFIPDITVRELFFLFMKFVFFLNYH